MEEQERRRRPAERRRRHRTLITILQSLSLFAVIAWWGQIIHTLQVLSNYDSTPSSTNEASRSMSLPKSASRERRSQQEKPSFFPPSFTVQRFENRSTFPSQSISTKRKEWKEWFWESSELSLLKNSTKDLTASVDHVAFLRLRKTASTSLLKFFYTTDGIIPLPNNIGWNGFVRDSKSPSDYSALPCIFSKQSKRLLRGRKIEFQQQQYCPHIDLEELVYSWSHSVPYMLQSTLPQQLNALNDNPEEDTLPVDVRLTVITLVRDPYQRLVSYFHYWRQVYPKWNHTVTDPQRSALISGNLPLFLQEAVKGDSNVLTQYGMVDANVDTAIALVQRGAVFAFATECFDLCLEWLVTQFPALFSNKSISSIDAAASLHANPTKKRPALHKDLLGEERNSNQTVTEAQARVWLSDEYKFYEAAIEAFRLSIVRSENQHLLSRLKSCPVVAV